MKDMNEGLLSHYYFPNFNLPRYQFKINVAFKLRPNYEGGSRTNPTGTDEALCAKTKSRFSWDQQLQVTTAGIWRQKGDSWAEPSSRNCFVAVQICHPKLDMQMTFGLTVAPRNDITMRVLPDQQASAKEIFFFHWWKFRCPPCAEHLLRTNFAAHFRSLYSLRHWGPLWYHHWRLWTNGRASGL